MGDDRLPKRIISEKFKNAGQRGPGGKEKECIVGPLASRGAG